MRISRLARIHNLSVQELASFLETLNPPLKSVHPNAKLENETINQVLTHFDLEVTEERISENPVTEENPGSDQEEGVGNEVKVDLVNEVPTEAVSAEAIESPEEEIVLQEDNPLIYANTTKEEIPLVQKKQQEREPQEICVEAEETILSDQLIELLDSEEPLEDLDKIKLIKAPKKKLSGLKVVDKIEIPEDPKKKSKEQEDQETSPRLQLTPEEKAERVRKREEYKEKRRLEAKKKQEEYEARKERRIKEQEERRLKAEREKHYQQQLTRQKTQQTTKKVRKATPTKEVLKAETSKPKPKTILGKFWRWLNT